MLSGAGGRGALIRGRGRRVCPGLRNWGFITDRTQRREGNGSGARAGGLAPIKVEDGARMSSQEPGEVRDNGTRHW